MREFDYWTNRTKSRAIEQNRINSKKSNKIESDLFSPKSDHYSPLHPVLEEFKWRDQCPQDTQMAFRVNYYQRSFFGTNILINSELFSLHVNTKVTLLIAFYSTRNFDACRILLLAPLEIFKPQV